MRVPPAFRTHAGRLHEAIRQDDAGKVKRLLSLKTRIPNAQCLKTAIASSSHSALEALLHDLLDKHADNSEKPGPPSSSHNTLIPALHAAAHSLDGKALSMLLANGADVRAVYKQREPLHIAIRTNARNEKPAEALEQTISILVLAGALKGKFQEHLYPPNYAIKHGNTQALSVMLSHRSLKLSRALRKHSTLRHACAHASLDSFRMLFPHVDRH